MPKLVRIRPNSPRAVHVIAGLTFRREKGWYRVEDDIAARLATEPLNDPDDGQLVFEVTDVETARAVAAAETRKADPAGTPEAPNVVMPSVIEAPPEPVAPKPAPVPANLPGAPRGRRMRAPAGE